MIEEIGVEVLHRAESALQKSLDSLPVGDRWAISARVLCIAAVRSSAYIDDEMWSARPEGDAQATGLSGREVGARTGDVVTVVTMAAANSGRSRPIVMFNHGNGRFEVLHGNFAPLLRSRHEGWVLMACGLGALTAFSLPLWLSRLTVWLDRLNSILIFAGFGLLALGIAFPTGRRRRLRRSLEDLCRSLVERLQGVGRVDEAVLEVSPDSLPQS